MKFIALFSLISVAFAAPELLGTKECTYGPSYWCSHISRAQKCRAVEHCMSTVWKNQIIKPKDTTECQLCQFVMKEAQQMLKDKKTEAEVEKYLPEVCKLISDATTKATCEKDMKEYLPVVLKLIESGLTPQQICATLKLCTGFEDTVPHQEIKKPTQVVKVNADDVCKHCKDFFTDVQNMIMSNETVQQIDSELEQTICAQLGPIQGVCNFVVEEYVPQLLTFAGQAVNPPTTCRVIGFCNTNGDIETALKVRMQFMKMLKELKKESVTGQEECDACKSIMSDIQALDRDPTAQGKVTDFVKTYICGKLSALQQDCDNMVDTYAPVLFELLANELDPVTTCTFLGLCTSSAVETKKQPMLAMSLVPAMPVKKVKPVKTDDTLCELCKFAMTELDSVIAKNATDKEIEAALDQICTRLPGNLTDQCKAFVKQYLPAILVLLKQELEPKTVCVTLGICSAHKSQIKIKTTKKVNSAQCVVCEFVMSELDSLIQKNASQAEIEAALDKVCDLLPSTISAECNAFVQTYAPTIIKLLLQKITPQQVCTTLGLCTSTVRVLPKPVVPVTGILLRGEPVVNQEIKTTKKANDEKCEVCELIMSKLDDLLKNNATESDIKDALQKVCDLMPSSLSGECVTFVDQYTPMIVRLLLTEATPKTVCTAIGLCTSTIRALPKPEVPVTGILLRGEPVFNQKVAVQNKELCLVCEEVMNYVDMALKENKTVLALKALMEKACSYLPKEVGDECQGLIIAFGNLIIQELADNIDPKQVCEAIEVCPGVKISKGEMKTSLKEVLKNALTKPKKTQNNKLYFKSTHELLGRKECSYGPSYWCDSLENAKKCQMVEHCKTKVWKRN